MANIKGFLKRNKAEILIIIIFLILPFIFFKDIGKINSVIFGLGDAEYYSVPFQWLASDSIRNFEPMLWNRYTFSGYPLLPQFGLLSPIPILFGLIFPTIAAYNLSVLLHYSLAGIFLFLFLKEYNLNKFACFLGGLIFMFSGAMITHRDLTQSIYTFIWIPLVLLFLEKFRKTGKYKFIFAGSIFYSISFLGSHQQIFLYGSMAILAYILYYSLLYQGIRNYRFLVSLTIFIITALMVSFVIIPTYELGSLSTRDAISYTFFTDFSFNPKLLPVLFFPFIFGSGSQAIPDVPEYFGPWNPGEMLIYFGISTMTLLIFGLFAKNKHKYLWIFIMAFSFLLVLGRYTPLYKLMYHVPIYNKFRVPARNWFEFGLAFSMLAGFGLDYFISCNSRRVRKILTGAIVFLGTVLAGFIALYVLINSRLVSAIEKLLKIPRDELELLVQNIKLANYSVYAPLIIITLSIGILILLLYKKNKITFALLAVLIFLDLFSMGHFLDENRNVPYIYNRLEESAELSFLKEKEELFRVYPLSKKEISGFKLYPNMNFYNRVDIISGYGPLLLEDYGYITELKNDPGWGTDWEKFLKNNDILSMLNVKYIILPKPEDRLKTLEGIGHKNYAIVYDGNDEIILENKNYLPRFYFANNLKGVEDLEEVKEIIWAEENDSFNPSGTALVQDLDFAGKSFDSSEASIDVVKYGSSIIVLNAESETGNFLIFSDNYYPGWKAFVDNIEVKIYRVNGILKGILLPEGLHRIIFKYQPTYYILTLVISLLTFLGAVIAIFLLNFKKRWRKKLSAVPPGNIKSFNNNK